MLVSIEVAQQLWPTASFLPGAKRGMQACKTFSVSTGPGREDRNIFLSSLYAYCRPIWVISEAIICCLYPVRHQACAQAVIVERNSPTPVLAQPVTIAKGPVEGTCQSYKTFASPPGAAGSTSYILTPDFTTTYSPPVLRRAEGFWCGCNSTLYKTYADCDREGACRPEMMCFASLCFPKTQEQVCLRGIAEGGFQATFTISLRQWSLPKADQDASSCKLEAQQFADSVVSHENQHEKQDEDEIDRWNRKNGNGAISAEACAATVSEAKSAIDTQISKYITSHITSLMSIIKDIGEPPGIEPMDCSKCPE